MSFDNIERLKSINNLDAFWDEAHFVAKQFGITGMMYCYTPSLYSFYEHGIKDGGFYKTSYPSNYLDYCGINELLWNDASTIYCCDNDEPLNWEDPFFINSSTPDQLKQLEIDNSFGIQFGVTVPFSSNEFKGFGGLGMCAGECTKKEFDEIWDESGREIHLLAATIDVCIRKQHMEEIFTLRHEEKEVLKWMSVGLQQDEIGFRLGLSVRKVNYLTHTLKEKLNCKNNTHAVAKAIIYGLITP